MMLNYNLWLAALFVLIGFISKPVWAKPVDWVCWIAAEEMQWDYAPSVPINPMTSNEFSAAQRVLYLGSSGPGKNYPSFIVKTYQSLTSMSLPIPMPVDRSDHYYEKRIRETGRCGSRCRSRVYITAHRIGWKCQFASGNQSFGMQRFLQSWRMKIFKKVIWCMYQQLATIAQVRRFSRLARKYKSRYQLKWRDLYWLLERIYNHIRCNRINVDANKLYSCCSPDKFNGKSAIAIIGNVGNIWRQFRKWMDS